MEVVVTTKLTTNAGGQETTATVMTAKELAQQIKFRGCLAHAVLYRARGKVKDQLRATGLKVSGFSGRDLCNTST
jgi:hypothetical protein